MESMEKLEQRALIVGKRVHSVANARGAAWFPKNPRDEGAGMNRYKAHPTHNVAHSSTS